MLWAEVWIVPEAAEERSYLSGDVPGQDTDALSAGAGPPGLGERLP